MYNYLQFFFTVQNLYDIDFLTAYTFIYEYLKWDSDIGDVYTCFMSPKHVNNIPSNLIKSITFFEQKTNFYDFPSILYVNLSESLFN